MQARAGREDQGGDSYALLDSGRWSKDRGAKSRELLVEDRRVGSRDLSSLGGGELGANWLKDEKQTNLPGHGGSCGSWKHALGCFL